MPIGYILNHHDNQCYVNQNQKESITKVFPLIHLYF